MAVINGTSGADTITAGGVTSGVTGGLPTDNADTILGFDGNDSIDGGGGTDSLVGGDGADTIYGNAGDDTLAGALGSDLLFGQSGNDLFLGGVGSDTINGGDVNTERNSVTYSGVGSPISVVYTSFSVATATKAGGETDTLQQINQITGTAGADTFDGTAIPGSAANTYNFQGGAGNDSLVGSNNARVVADYSNAPKAVAVDLGAGLATQDGYDGVDTLKNIARVNATLNFDDTLTGGAFNDTFMVLGAGGSKTINGGAGNGDIYRYSGADAVTIDLAAGTAVKVGGGSDTLSSIEWAGGGAGSDTIRGDAQNNTLYGNLGNDLIDGRDGFDTADYAFFWNKPITKGVTANLITNQATDSWDGTDTFISIEALGGTAFGDDLTGVDLVSRGFTTGTYSQLRGAGGNDTLHAASLTDRVAADYRFDPGAIRANLSDVTLTLGGVQVTAHSVKDGYGGTDLLDKVSGVIGSSSADWITGGAAAERLWGFSGNDVLAGGGGNDSLYGGQGIDSYSGGDGFDIISFAPYFSSDPANTAGAVANLATGLISNDGYGNAETILGGDVEQLIGTALADDLTGKASTTATQFGVLNQVHLQGGRGADTLRAAVEDGHRVAADYGSDPSSNGGSAGITADLGGQWARDGWGDIDTFVHIEAVRGSAFADSLLGNDDDNWFRGGAGADTLDGRGGTDVASYWDSAGALVDLVAGTAQDGTGSVDKLISIEDLRGSETGADTLLGDAVANEFFGYGGNDRLDGADGNDTLMGHTGQDTLLGGTGQDYLGGGGDSDSLDGGSGDDTLDSGSGNDSVTGGTGNDQLDGFTGNDLLDGGAGNDTITAGGGADTLLGGSGNDVLDGGADNDTLKGNDGRDTLSGGLGDDSLSGVAGDDSITGGEGRDLLDGGEGADSLDGEAGNDRLEGWTGDDSLSGGDGNDRLMGEQGNDTLQGGAGLDILWGGDGADYFVLAFGSGNEDRISDFTAGDLLEVHASEFVGLSAGSPLLTTQLTIGRKAVGGAAQFVYVESTGKLYWDADGSGAGTAEIVARFETPITLHASDFVVIA